MSFSINCLEITKNPEKIFNGSQENNFYKILKKGKYLFNDLYKLSEDDKLCKTDSSKGLPSNFFGNNINIQAIVGKNGSGKSTLMDLLYLAINNFAFLLINGKDRNGLEFLGFVPNLYVDIYFSIENSDYVLSCEDSTIDICEVNKDFSRKSILEHPLSVYLGTNTVNSIANEELKKITSVFFYTIVSNYSFQSFISTNYVQNVICEINRKKQDESATDAKKAEDVSIEEKENAVELVQRNVPWINGIFHKNDSYLRPIVLNPYRNNGVIDLKKELSLSKERLLALLIDAAYDSLVEDKAIDGRYSLKEIEYSFDEKYAVAKLYQFYDCKPQPRQNDADLEGKFDDIAYIYKEGLRIVTEGDWHAGKGDVERQIDALLSNPQSLFSCINQVYGFGYNKDSDFRKKITLAFLVRKICTIVYTYDSYSSFRNVVSVKEDRVVNNVELVYKETNPSEAIIQKLKNKLDGDPSHVTTKLRRILTYIDLNENEDKFTYSAYRNFLSSINFNSLDDILNTLPPPFFNCTILLNDNTQTEKIQSSSEGVDYNSLSSGELQMLQTLAVHMYHIRNILSNNLEDRISYRNINMVFDELEICFHPEMQRQFVGRLICMLTKLFIKEDSANNPSFNVFILTHSPFILSDIPNGRILYMKEGAMDEKKCKSSKPFAGNVGEMLYDSFFLEKTIGDFAESKLRELIKKRQGKKTSMSDDEAETLLNNIGDPVIRSLIEEVEPIK